MKCVYFWREMQYKYKRDKVTLLGRLWLSVLIGRRLHPYLPRRGESAPRTSPRLPAG